MKAFFSTCSEAIDKAVTDKSFGLYYSDSTHPNQTVHVHDCCEIFLSLSDGDGFLIDNKIYKVSKNCLFLINNFQAHKVNPNTTKFSRYSLHVHPKFLYDNSTAEISLGQYFYAENKPNVIKLTEKESAKLVTLFKSLTKDYGYADEIHKNIRVVEIILETIELCKNHQVAIVDESDTPLNTALNFINQNFTKQLSLQDIAKNSFLSTNKLCALFKQHLSTTVIKYLTGKRISHAKKLLCEGKSVTETAFECGFNDYANFIRTFKNSVGVPPGKYRTDKTR